MSGINDLEFAKFLKGQGLRPKIDSNGDSFVLTVTKADYFNAIALLIGGSMPEINWNKISKTTNNDGSLTYLFEYFENQQFTVNVTNPYGDYVITVSGF